MTQQILQINFTFDTTVEAFENGAAAVAEYFAAQPGLLWKIWLLNKERKEAGGIYLFEDEEAAATYLHSHLFQNGPGNPAFDHLSVKQFSVLEKPGIVTRAPVAASVLR